MKQRIAETIGASGCYFLCLLKVAEKITGKKISLLEAYDIATLNKYMSEDCYMVYPDLFLTNLTGRKFSVRKEGKDYKAKANEIEIVRYEWQAVGTTYAHFCLVDGLRLYDPYGQSKTRINGKVVSKRIFA